MPYGDLTVACGNINILIKKGDITSERTDAIVNITGSDFAKSNGSYDPFFIKSGLDHFDIKGCGYHFV